MLEEALVSYLTADSGVNAQLGVPRVDKSTGIYPSIAPDEPPMPYVVYIKLTGDPMTTSFEGTNALLRAHYRFYAYGTTALQAKKLAKAVHDALLALPVHQVNLPAQVEIDEVWCTDDGQDGWEPLMHGTLYSTFVAFQFNYLDMTS